MSQPPAPQRIYLCPMHSEVRQADPGKCPKCGMALLPEGARFGLLQHMTRSPLHLVIMGCCDGPRDGGRHDAYALIVAPPVSRGGTIEPDPTRTRAASPTAKTWMWPPIHPG
jgi:hypothetical protein